MTRDEAIAYIRSHPAQFKGASEPEILSKTQSANDPNYYNPTLFDPEQKATVSRAKPNVVGPSQSKKPAATPYKAPPVALADARQGLFSKASLPALPVTLALGLIALGAGMAIYRVSK